jgi:hypothetical protein
MYPILRFRSINREVSSVSFTASSGLFLAQTPRNVLVEESG